HDGFKVLPVDKPTGFERNNFTLRWDKAIKPMNQNLTLKFNWSDEDSNETYLGLTEDDFATNPFQRYSASQDDLMRWKHQQFFASHSIQPSEDLNIKTTLYHHDFYRSWDKNNGFFDSTIDVNEVLRTPNLSAFNQFYQVLTGASNSLLSGDRDVLRQTNNTRTYYSQGIQTKLDYELPATTWSHIFSLGYRFHRDEVDRDHVSRFFSMQNNSLVFRNDLAIVNEKFNVSQAEAHTVTLGYEATLESLFVQAALRYEDISYEEFDQLAQTGTESDDDILAPGLGLFYELFNNGGLLFGVNKGFTPVGPGQNSDINPEESMNYEFGIRYSGNWGAELIGFYSDYTNILGTCTQSSGCTVANLDLRFNGGEAEIYGAEFLLNKDFKSGAVTIPVRLNGTLTQTRFNSQFETEFNDWGIGTIDPGDPIPYIPEFQA
ncbi:MAG: TonB-dependent receptor, partial [Bdellovibrionales bacterium]|nr:TonB-dependent receptor [Bdellovibrionales bacterium]